MTYGEDPEGQKMSWDTSSKRNGTSCITTLRMLAVVSPKNAGGQHNRSPPRAMHEEVTTTMKAEGRMKVDAWCEGCDFRRHLGKSVSHGGIRECLNKKSSYGIFS